MVAALLAISQLAIGVLSPTAAWGAERENAKELESKARAGDTHAQYLMGLDSRPLTKKESEQNLEDAYAWLKVAAVRGHYRAAAELDVVNSALKRTGRTEKADVRYQEISALIATKPKENLTYRLIADPAIGYKFYASSRWGEPKIEGNTLTLQLKTGGTAWLMLDPCTKETDKDLRERIKSVDPVLAMTLLEMMKTQFGDARLVKHGPSADTVVRNTYYVIAEIPADRQYRARASLMVVWPGVDRLVMLQFTTFKENVQRESDDFSGLVETYSYTSPELTKAMENFVKGLSTKK